MAGAPGAAGGSRWHVTGRRAPPGRRRSARAGGVLPRPDGRSARMGHWIDTRHAEPARIARLARRAARAAARRAGRGAGDLRRQRAYPRRRRPLRRARLRRPGAGPVRPGRAAASSSATTRPGVARGRDLVAQARLRPRARRASPPRASCCGEGRRGRRRRLLLGRHRGASSPTRGLDCRRSATTAAAPCRSCDEPLRAPMMFHFGEHDPIIPPDDVAGAPRGATRSADVHV